MVPTWLPSLLGPRPCRFPSSEKEHEPLSQSFREIHSDQTRLITFPVPSSKLSREGEALISIGPTPRAATVTSEPHGLKGVGMGQIQANDSHLPV